MQRQQLEAVRSWALSLAALLGLVGCAGERVDDRRTGHPVQQAAPRPAAPPATAAAAAAPAPPFVNPAPYIPPQCYTKSRDDGGGVHNPCFTCHVDGLPPNYVADHALQLSYAFGPRSRRNPWSNLFADRSAAVAAISDADILAYVRHDNYGAAGAANQLAARLSDLPDEWDSDGDGRWGGWLPDVGFCFDDAGYDRGPDGSYTGWRAYAYYSVPGTFWPTNGSFGDVLIRLPAPFREDSAGRPDRAVYDANLAILEALIARRDVAIDPADERRLGADLDGDGQLATATLVRYRWQPGGGGMSWAGRAAALQQRGAVHLAAGLFPEGTELAHSVRYLDVDGDHVCMAPRMKELRYLVKQSWIGADELRQLGRAEGRESYANASRGGVRPVIGDPEHGVDNGAGWRIQAFIEDAGGGLRPQSLEEHGFCIGCHGGIGATDDSVFSFGRKLPADRFQRGWYHASQRGLSGLPEPLRADGSGEYADYLERNGAGDELRGNQEVLARFFDRHGALRPEMARRLRDDVSLLLVPSPARGLALDKAYRVIVAAQSFVRGRDATVTPATSVYREVPDGDRPTDAPSVLDRRRGAALIYPGLPRPAARH